MSDHKRFAPSSMHRVLTCTASLRFIESLPPSAVDRSDSIYARRGSAGHTVSEMVLANSSFQDGQLQELSPVHTYLGASVGGIVIDEEIIAACVPYIKYCQRQMRVAKFSRIESKLDLGIWKFLKNSDVDGSDCGGTMDFISIYNSQKHTILEVTDLKTGAGVPVQVENNPQLLTYALCALIRYWFEHRPDRIKITIAQQPVEHPKGPIRSVTLTPKKLINWGKSVLIPKLEEALSDKAVFAPSPETCQWCPGRAQCKARYDMVCDSALAEFSDVVEVMDDGTKKDVVVMDIPKMSQLTDAQRHNIMIHGDEIIKFVQDIKAAAHVQAERGKYIDGFKLVRKRANRIYKTEPKTVISELERVGLKVSDFMSPPVLKSPAQVETLFSAKGISLDKVKRFLHNNVEKPESGTNLVPESHSGKAVEPEVETEFAHLIEREDDEDLLAF